MPGVYPELAMPASFGPDRIFSELDHARISRLAQQHVSPDGNPPAIVDTLDEGDTVSPRDIPPDVVTMNSRVLVSDTAGDQREVVLCYPKDADIAQGKLSILSPIGAELLGRRVGEEATFATPNGKETTLRVDGIPFQPEASGDYLL